ncbi:MAG: bile acid:sodium symporter family protein [Cyanobacteria bacterium P01_D01_bin.128]
MESSFLSAVFLPLALFVIMLGMGLSLTVEDFKRVWVEPKAMIVGLSGQLILLPALGFLLALIFPLSPELAVGVVILAACPGGPTSNMFTYLAKGNVALSISLTAISSLVTVFTIPLVVNGAMQVFLGEAVTLRLPFLTTVLQIAAITMVPVSIGMVLHRYAPRFAATAEKGVKWASMFFLALIIFGLLLKERENVVSFFAQVGSVSAVLLISAMTAGAGIALLAKLNRPSTTAITIEVGLQNGTLAIAIASAPTFLNTPEMAIPGAIYSLMMLAVSAVFAGWAQRRARRLQPLSQ